MGVKKSKKKIDTSGVVGVVKFIGDKTPPKKKPRPKRCVWELAEWQGGGLTWWTMCSGLTASYPQKHCFKCGKKIEVKK